MITIEKLKIFEKYKGDIDMWCRVNDKLEREIIQDDDWHQISTLIQRITIVKRGLASASFSKEVVQSIENYTKDDATAKALYEYAMGEIERTENNDKDYKVCLWGTTVSKHEANKIGLAIIIGCIGAVLSLLIFGPQNKITALFISFALAVLGYFGVANKVFKDNSKT